MYVSGQGLNVLTFNRNDHKPHVFLTISSICKKKQKNKTQNEISLTDQYNNQLCKIELNMVF